MSLMDTPMALVDRILRRPPVVPPDEPMKISVSSAVARKGMRAAPRQSTTRS